MDYEYKKVEQSNLTLEPIISDDEKSSIFKTLLDNLFVNDSSEFNDSTIKQLHIDQEKVEILTSWFNETSNDMNVFKVTKSINEFTGIPYTIFNDYIKSDRTKTLWELFKLLDNKSLKKYIYQNRPDFIMYVCTRPEDSLNDQPLSIVSLEKGAFSCTSCGYFLSLDRCCPHLLLLYVSDRYKLVPEEINISKEEEWLELLRRSTPI